MRAQSLARAVGSLLSDGTLMEGAVFDVVAVFVFVVASVTFVVIASWPTDPDDRLADQAKHLAHGRSHRK